MKFTLSRYKLALTPAEREKRWEKRTGKESGAVDPVLSVSRGGVKFGTEVNDAVRSRCVPLWDCGRVSAAAARGRPVGAVPQTSRRQTHTKSSSVKAAALSGDRKQT